MRNSLLLGLLGVCLAGTAVAGCGGKRRAEREALAGSTPEELVALARARKVPFALRATFGISVKGPTTSGSTRGGMVTHQPDNVRLDVFTPLNTPMLYLASDGDALHAWVQQDRTFYRGDSAGAVLDELLGGLVGMEDVIDLLTGTLPLDDAPVQDARYDAERDLLAVVLEGPKGVQVQAWLTPGDALLRELRVVQPPLQVLMEARYDDYTRVEGDLLPADIALSFPPVGWSVELSIDTWSPLGQIPDVFHLAPPAGAIEKDLVESLREMAEKQQAAGATP